VSKQHREVRLGFGAALVRNGIDATICFGSILGGPLAGVRERDLVYGAEAEVAPLAIDRQAHGPALAAALVDLKIEAPAVCVPTGCREVFDRGGREAMDALGIMLSHESQRFR